MSKKEGREQGGCWRRNGLLARYKEERTPEPTSLPNAWWSKRMAPYGPCCHSRGWPRHAPSFIEPVRFYPLEVERRVQRDVDGGGGHKLRTPRAPAKRHGNERPHREKRNVRERVVRLHILHELR